MPNETKKDIKSLLPAELEAEFAELGLPKFRARQVFKWLSAGVSGFDEMTDLSKDLRAKLDGIYQITVPVVLRRQTSASDGTEKFLWGLSDGNAVESVLMCYDYGNSVCVSSQVGCNMGCAFCASRGGKVRDLRPSEILDQVLWTEKETGKKVSNIVMMGIGEPLDNFENVERFLRLVNCPEGLNIGMRHISLSTCGLVPGIDRLAELDLQLTLSVSLHAPDDETRSELMPVDRRWNVAELTDACRRYFEKTGRRISFEYALIRGVNDSDAQADMLAALMKKVRGHVNLIPLNEVEGSPLKPGDAKRFAAALSERGVNVTVRRRLGADIDAACGQLIKRTMKETR